MSGPVTTGDTQPWAETDASAASSPQLEVTESRTGQVGAFTVRRALPRRARRTIGPWCFVDHMGPAAIDEHHGLDVAPHPHIGLQTVTWLFQGEALHRDSLGTEQVIAPGHLNLMTAGHGVSHSEEGTGRYRGDLHGVQLWIAQPERTRHREPDFEHLTDLPRIGLGHGTGTVLVGELAGAESPARRDTDHAGIDLDLRPGTTELGLRPDYEHGLIVFTGAASVDGTRVEPGHLAYLGTGRDEVALTTRTPTRALLIGGIPLGEPVLVWWNYVARTRDEITTAHQDWTARADRFGHVNSTLAGIDVPPPPWSHQ